jgi:hypothetical protein
VAVQGVVLVDFGVVVGQLGEGLVHAAAPAGSRP